MKRWQLVLAMSVVFFCGALLGGVITLRSVQRRFAERMNPNTWSPRTMNWLTEELTLTADQQNKMQPAVSRMVDELKRLQTNVDAERKAIYGKLLMEIFEDLTVEQRETLRTVLKSYSKGKTPNVGLITR